MATEKKPAKKARSGTGPKVMDVAKPGKSAPATTSRPVIVTHRPMMQDPMVNAAVPAADPVPDATKPTEKPMVHGPKIIVPLSSADGLKQTDENTPAEVFAPESTPAPETPVLPAEPESKSPTMPPEKTPPAKELEPISEPETETPGPPQPKPSTDTPKPAEEEEKSDDGDTDESGVVDAFAEQAAAKKEKTQTDAETQKRQEALNKLIEEKKYFVPVGQVSHRRHTKWALLLLALLFLVAACTFAIDAEVLDVGIELPFDLIKM